MGAGASSGHGPFVVKRAAGADAGAATCRPSGRSRASGSRAGRGRGGSLRAMGDPPPRRRPDPWSWVALVCAVAFAILALILNGQGALGFDDPAIAFARGLPIPTEAWQTITQAGGAILVPVGLAIVVVLLIARRPRSALVYGIALLVATGWTQFVKGALERTRPPGGELIATGYSFPSGHTLNSSVTYGLIALLVWRSPLPRWLRVVTAIALAILIGLIGLSRIALGAHYPSDVVGGWLAGLAIVATVATFTGDGLGDPGETADPETRAVPTTRA